MKKAIVLFIGCIFAIGMIACTGNQKKAEVLDTATLDLYISQVEVMKEESFTPYTWENLQKAYRTAISMKTNDTSAQGDIRRVQDGLKEAIDALRPALEPSDYSGLEYESIIRNPNDWLGENVVLSGIITQTGVNSNTKTFYLDMNGNPETPIAVVYPKDLYSSNFLERDVVTIFGYIDSVQDVSSSSGKSRSIPVIWADTIDLQE